MPTAKFKNVSAARSRTMRAIKSKGTSIEVLLARTLADRGMGFCRRNVRGMPGTPDFVFEDHGAALFPRASEARRQALRSHMGVLQSGTPLCVQEKNRGTLTMR